MKRSTWKEKMFNVEVDINIVTRVKPMIRWRRASVSNSEILLAQPDWLNYQFLTEWHMNSSNESNNDQKSHAAIVLVPKDVLVDFFFITYYAPVKSFSSFLLRICFCDVPTEILMPWSAILIILQTVLHIFSGFHCSTVPFKPYGKSGTTIHNPIQSHPIGG